MWLWLETRSTGEHKDFDVWKLQCLSGRRSSVWYWMI
jgi:hypothetical protein